MLISMRVAYTCLLASVVLAEPRLSPSVEKQLIGDASILEQDEVPLSWPDNVEIVFLRHGQTFWNEVEGNFRSPLTKLCPKADSKPVWLCKHNSNLHQVRALRI